MDTKKNTFNIKYKDPNQKDCVTLKLETKTVSSGTELTYTIGPDFSPHSKTTGTCNYKGASYYACLIPPALMVLVGMGLVYAIYPGIAPGMIVPFYLVDKIEMVLLIATAFPPVIIKLIPEFDQRLNPYVLMGSWGVYHQKLCKSGKPERKGCEGTSPEKTITSVKLAVSGGNKHTITLTGSGDPTDLTHSKTITLNTGSGTGTLTIKLPGGGTIKLTQLSIESSNTLKIQNSVSKVSVTKGSNKINLSSATLTGTKLTITSGNGETEVLITGDPVDLNYSGSGDITIEGTAIQALELPFIATDEDHLQHKTTNCCIYGKVYEWSDSNPNAVWWNIFNILMPIQIALAGIFIYSLHYTHIANDVLSPMRLVRSFLIVFIDIWVPIISLTTATLCTLAFCQYYYS